MFLLSFSEAMMLVKYLFDVKIDTCDVNLMLVVKTDAVEFRFEKLIGGYMTCSDDVIDSITLEFIL